MSVTLRKRKLPSGTTQLLLDIYVGGKRRREALHLYLTPDARENKEIMRTARAIRAKREIEIHSDEHSLEPSRSKRVNFFTIAKVALESKSSPTREVYDNALKQLETFGGKQLTFDQVTPRFCEAFKKYLTSKLRSTSAGAYFARFRGIINYAVKEKILMENPAEGISVRVQQSLPKYLTAEDLALLAKAECGNPIVKDAFLFSCLTGLRYEDVNSLAWEQVRGNAIEFTQKKTSASERMPLAPQALEILQRQRRAKKSSRVKREHDPNIIFKLPAQQTTDKVLKSWAKRAGLKPISFHKARHTFATLAHAAGVDIFTVSKLLGHKDLHATQVYARVLDQSKLDAVQKLPRIGE